MLTSPLLSVRSLKKIYRGNPPFVAVDGISFDLHAGEILGLLGPNGAGKTTTIQMLLSTLKPTAGSILYFGKDFFKYRSEILQKISFASTYVSLPGNLTVWQNLNVFGHLYSLSSSETKKRAIPLLERFGIAHKLSSRAGDLSAGQITRLMLVKAFMIRPQLVLLDEPTASLDPDVAKEVIDFIFEQKKLYGTSMLYTSHNMAEVAQVCDRVLFMKGGQIVADDLPSKLARSILPFRLSLQIGEGLEQAVQIANQAGIKHQIAHHSIECEMDESKIAFFLSALAKAEIVYTTISIKEPNLEDYFLHMVGKRGASR